MHLRGGGGQGGLNLPLPVPFNPGSRPVFFGSRLFAFFRLWNIAQCCINFPFSPASRHLGNPASRPLFSRLPYTSRPLFSRSPAPLSLPTLNSYDLFTLYGYKHSRAIKLLNLNGCTLSFVKWSIPFFISLPVRINTCASVLSTNGQIIAIGLDRPVSLFINSFFSQDLSVCQSSNGRGVTLMPLFWSFFQQSSILNYK